MKEKVKARLEAAKSKFESTWESAKTYLPSCPSLPPLPLAMIQRLEVVNQKAKNAKYNFEERVSPLTRNLVIVILAISILSWIP